MTACFNDVLGPDVCVYVSPSIRLRVVLDTYTHTLTRR